MKKIKKTIINFIKSDDRTLVIPYEGSDLNPLKYWHKILFRNFFSAIFRGFIIIISTILPASEFKNFLLRMTGMKIGKGVFITSGTLFDSTFPQLVTIKDGAVIGTGTKIFTHEVSIKSIKIGRVIIGKQALIGIRSLIRCGVLVDDYAVVGMNSLVIKDVLTKTMVVGTPSREIKKLEKLI